MSSLLLKDLLFQNLFIFTAAGVKCCVAALKGLPVLHHSADYIVWSFGHCVFYGVECSSGVEYWSGGGSNFGVKMWVTFPSIQTKPGHIFENTKNINFHSACMGANAYQTL